MVVGDALDVTRQLAWQGARTIRKHIEGIAATITRGLASPPTSMRKAT